MVLCNDAHIVVEECWITILYNISVTCRLLLIQNSFKVVVLLSSGLYRHKILKRPSDVIKLEGFFYLIMAQMQTKENLRVDQGQNRQNHATKCTNPEINYTIITYLLTK